MSGSGTAPLPTTDAVVTSDAPASVGAAMGSAASGAVAGCGVGGGAGTGAGAGSGGAAGGGTEAGGGVGALLREVEAGFETVGSLIEAARFRQALQEVMRLAALGNQYVAEQAPWSKLDADRERAATILYVALRAVDGLKTLLTPFLPFSAQRLHVMLGYDDVIAGPLAFESVDEGGAEHVVLTGDYASWRGRWEPSALPAGQELREPGPLFAKLDPERVVADELARMDAAAAP